MEDGKKVFVTNDDVFMIKVLVFRKQENLVLFLNLRFGERFKIIGNGIPVD